LGHRRPLAAIQVSETIAYRRGIAMAMQTSMDGDIPANSDILSE